MGLFTEEWVGFDLDATLAEYFTVYELFDIGKPVPAMMAHLKALLAEGKYEIKIFTARASVPGQKELIQSWLAANGLPRLDITDRKDFRMAFYFDDRARQVVPNAGKIVGE